MVDYVSAIKKPFQDMQTLAIGIVLGIIPVVSLLVSGYALGVGRKVINGDKSLPKFSMNEIAAYIKDLIFSIIISIVYALPGLIVLGIGLAAALGSLVAGFASGDQTAIANGIMAALAAGGIFFILGIILAMIGGLFALMGVFYYLKEGSIGAAFNFGGVLKKVLTVTFWVTAGIYIITAIAYFAVMLVLSIIPVIGTLVGSGLMVYGLATTAYTMFGEVFKETQ